MSDIDHANQLADMAASELNVKEFKLLVGHDELNREISVVLKHDTVNDRILAPLDVYHDGKPKNLPELAAQMVLKHFDTARQYV